MFPALDRDNRRLLVKLVVVTLAMAGFGYSLVPLYRTICNALGINVLSVSERVTSSGGLFGVAARPDAKSVAANTQVDASRTVTIEFDANSRGPFRFKPGVASMQVHPGQVATVVYTFRNVEDRTLAAQAIPSYAPKVAAAHFAKIECFCFNEYVLKPGEERAWPVVFVVDAKLPRDVTTITLSYTFFEVAGKVPAAARTPAPTGAGA